MSGECRSWTKPWSVASVDQAMRPEDSPTSGRYPGYSLPATSISLIYPWAAAVLAVARRAARMEFGFMVECWRNSGGKRRPAS